MTRQKPVPLPNQYSKKAVRSDGFSDRIYIDGSLARFESIDGQHEITIARPDLGVIYTFWPDLGEYISIPYTEEMQSIAGQDVFSDEEWEFVADNEIDGESVKEYKVYREHREDFCARVFVLDCGIRKRKITYNRKGIQVLTIETSEVVLGPQPKELFELPEGLTESS